MFRRNDPTPAPITAPVPDPPHPLGPQATRQVAIPPGQHRRMFPEPSVVAAQHEAAVEQERLETARHEATKRAKAERLAQDEAARGRKVQVAAAAAAAAANEVALLRNRVAGALNGNDPAGAIAAQQELTAALAVAEMAKTHLASARASR